MATANSIAPVPTLPPELDQLARWLDALRSRVSVGAAASGDYINVKAAPFGAVGDGVTDDYAAIQAALTYATTNGGTVFFPAGTYLCNSALTMDTGTSWAHYGPRACLKGAGSANTRLLCTAASVQFLTIGGFGAQYYVDISDIYFQGPGTVDTTGHPAIDGYGTGTAITVQASSWSSFKGCVVRGWGTGIYVTDTFSIMFESCYVASNLNGIYLTSTIYAHPNAITFLSSGIGDNKNYGVYAPLATLLTMHGGSVEGNGIGGSGAFVGGVYVSSGPDGVCPVSFTGVYFEGNAGTADVFIDAPANPGANSISGCTFNRLSSTNYVTNNILVSAGAGVKTNLTVIGCGFQGFGSYSPSAARPYFTTSGSDASMSWSGCFFGSTTEVPTIKNYIAGGTGVDNLARVIYTGGAGPYTAVPTLTGCPTALPSMWVKITTDAVVSAGYSGAWIPMWPEV